MPEPDVGARGGHVHLLAALDPLGEAAALLRRALPGAERVGVVGEAGAEVEVLEVAAGSSRRRRRRRWSGTACRPSGGCPRRRAASSSPSGGGWPPGAWSGARGRRRESSRVLVSAPIAIRQSASSAAHSDSGEIHSSCASEARLEVGRPPAPRSDIDTTGWPPAREHLLVDGRDQRLGRRRALDHAGLALAHLGRVVDQDAGQVVDPAGPSSSAPAGRVRDSAPSSAALGRRHRHQQRVHPRVVGELGVEGAERATVPCRTATG